MIWNKITENATNLKRKKCLVYNLAKNTVIKNTLSMVFNNMVGWLVPKIVLQ